MLSPSDDIVQQIRDKFDALLTYVTQTQADPPSLYQVEKSLLAHLLSLGRSLLLAFLLTQQAQIQSIPTVCVNGETLKRHGHKKRSLRSIFGKVTFARHYYSGEGTSYFLLDARLQLPEHSLSDLLREWLDQLAGYLPYRKTGGLLKAMIAQTLTTRPIEAAVAHDSALAEDFYRQASPPDPTTEAAILVAQADGKGVPMLPEGAAPTRVRLGKGEKRGRKKEAIVSSVYTIAACVRSPEAVVESLFGLAPSPKETENAEVQSRQKADKSGSRQKAGKRSGPQNKWLWATLGGKKAALEFMAGQVTLREGEHIAMRVALTDGSAPLQEQMQTALPSFVLVLDLIHAVEYLWEAGNRLLGETSKERDPWVRERVLLLLRGQTNQVISELRTLAAAPGCKKTAQAALTKVAGYYERNQAFMRYDAYLAEGWPIATGVIEGACRHLVKDRCEQAGMHWTLAGAEALLRLRSVLENADGEPFHAFRRERECLRLYGTRVAGQATVIQRAAACAREQAAQSKAA